MDENTDGLLMERHMAKVARRKSKNHLASRLSSSLTSIMRK